MKNAVFLFCFSFILIGCSTNDITSDNIERQAILIETAQATLQTIDENIELLGQALPKTQIPLFSPSALTVEKQYKRVGDVVNKNDIIVSLDNENAKRQVEQTKKAVSELEKAITQANKLHSAMQQDLQQLQLLQNELDETLKQTQTRLRGLQDENEDISLLSFIQSSLELTLKQAEIAQAAGNLQFHPQVNMMELENQLYLAKENVRQAELAMEATQIRSPIDGIVSELNIVEGQIANPTIPVATVADLTMIQATFSASSFQIGKLSSGLKAYVFIDGIAKPFESEILTVSPIINPQTNSFTIEIPINNESQQVKGGMKATAHIQVGKIENAITVPITSILYEDTQAYVYIVDNTSVIRRNVVLGNRSGQDIQVLEGIQDKDIVVTTGKERLTEGAEISIRNE